LKWKYGTPSVDDHGISPANVKKVCIRPQHEENDEGRRRRIVNKQNIYRLQTCKIMVAAI